ncbi:HEAT repeat domain-containing protein [bacterium]|nr:HEAT repeat domain-containing protein [bacterium]
MLLKGKLGVMLISFLVVMNVVFCGYAIEGDEEKQVITEQGEKTQDIADVEIKNKPEYSGLIEKLRDKKTKIRLDAVRELNRIGKEEIVCFLIDAIGDRKGVIQLESIAALGEIGGREAVDAIIEKGLTDKNKKVRLAAVNSLVRITGRSAIFPLKEHLLIEKDSKIRFRIINIFAVIGNDDVVSVLIESLNDSSLKNRLIAVNTLAIIGTPLAVSALANSLENEVNREEVSLSIIKTLGTIRSRDSVPVLIRMAAIRGKSEINKAAVESLGIIGDKRAIPVLNELSGYGDIRLRETVKEAINKILTKNALIRLRKRRSLQNK